MGIYGILFRPDEKTATVVEEHEYELGDSIISKPVVYVQTGEYKHIYELGKDIFINKKDAYRTLVCMIEQQIQSQQHIASENNKQIEDAVETIRESERTIIKCSNNLVNASIELKKLEQQMELCNREITK